MPRAEILMNPTAYALALLVLLCPLSTALCAEEPPVNDSPGRAGEWGFRPADGSSPATNPPAFVWRPQRGAVSYELECSRDSAFKAVAYRAKAVRYNCHCPPQSFEPGRWHWRFRFRDAKGTASAWSKVRSFVASEDAVPFPLPGRGDLLARIPKRHPRLFVRPGQLPHLRQLAQGNLKERYEGLVQECEKLLKKPPPSAEPPLYPKGTTRLSEEWRAIWWGNRVYTIKVLNGAATLAFTRLLGGKQEYGQLAKRLLLDAARWDPKGSTGYRYNDEAGMPYNYYFSRAYTFVNDLLTDEERALCRKVMAVRGREMYAHMARSHIWKPYGSHRNRAWHFLGEVGIAFLDEIPDAAEWVWFAANVFACAYPVWCDDDGGWHEGVSYWSSYIHRFTWWADVMRVAMDIDAYRKPYFSEIGTYPMYLQPPGTVGGGFGDLTARRRSSHNRALMTVLAAQARNRHWQWYVDAHGGPQREGGYVGFIRGTLPTLEAKPPDGLPTSRCFRGTGLAMLNTSLKSARSNVEVLFKSSPFGTQSHGYESHNSFLLYAFGERLLIRSGRRDIYGSAHHKKWMWHTKSTNCITVDGQGQRGHSSSARGEILAFHTSDRLDFVSGEAAPAYEGRLKRFTRSILFVKPELVLVYDRLEAPKPATFEWRLHAPTEMKVASQDDVRVVNGKAGCRVSFLHPTGLKLAQTNKFDPPPRPRVKLVEWHLTASTAERAPTMEFVTVIRPHRVGAAEPAGAKLHAIEGGYAVEATLKKGRVLVLLRAGDKGAIRFGDVDCEADIMAICFNAGGEPVRRLTVQGRTARE